MNATAAYRKAFVYGMAVVVVVAVAGAAIGGALVGPEGVWSALIAAALGAVLTLMTIGSLLVGSRIVRDDPGNPLFFAVVLGGWIVKFVVFLVAVLTLRDQPFVHPVVIFACLIAVVVGGVVADVVAVLRSRTPYVDAPLHRGPSDLP